ncbi:MAG: acyltransferase family protein [Erysipelotrichaceae bacterium]|nr:acyltransferase family protein [Erysipelotrichaceae bacterium]
MIRNKIVDLAKGIAIILMVIGHCYSQTNIIIKIIYAFHMPFFFIVSGILYREKSFYNNSDIFSLKKHLVTTFVPYFLFGILFSFLINILSYKNGFINGIIAGMYKLITMQGISTEWFLPCMFFSQLIFFIIYKIDKNKLPFICSVISLIVGVFVSISDVYLTVLWRILIGFGFFSVGFYGRNIFMKMNNLTNNFIILLIFILLLTLNGNVNLVSLEFSNGFIYIVDSVIGSYLLLQLCHFFVNSSKIIGGGYLLYVGKNSIIILVTHMFIIEIVRLVDYKFFDNFLPSLGLLEGLIFCLIVMLIESILLPFINNYIPFVLGKVTIKN